MNKTLATLMAIAVALPAATPAIARPNDHDNHGHDVRAAAHTNTNVRVTTHGRTTVATNHGAQVRQVARANPFRKGQRFVSTRAPYYQVIDYRQHRRLGAPPRGYHWVRSGNDALLVAITSGIIASVVTSQF